MSSHLIIVQGLNLTENYQSTNQDKKDKILSYKTASTTVISVMLCRGSMIWFRNFLVHTEVLNGSLEKRSTFELSNTLYTKHLIELMIRHLFSTKKKSS